MDLFLVFAVALAPALLWAALFFRLDRKNSESLQWLFLAFLSGALAVLPVLGFSEIWRLFSGVDWISWSDARATTGITSIAFVIFLAAAEEFFKHKALLSTGSEVAMRFDELSDGIVYAVAAALGFAFLENAVYFWALFQSTNGFSSDFAQIAAVRGIGTTLAHLVFSGIFGYFWGIAVLTRLDERFSAFKKQESRGLRQFLTKFYASSDRGKSGFQKFFETLTLRTIRAFLSPKTSPNSLSSVSLVAEGFWLATVAHTLFNLALSSTIFGHSTLILAVPICIFGLSFLISRFTISKTVSVHEKIAS